MTTFEVRYTTKSRLEALSALPWIARLPKKGKVTSELRGTGEVAVRQCEEYCHGRMPVYAFHLVTSREKRIDDALFRGEELSDEDQQYWEESKAKSVAARAKGRCKLNAGWLYVDVFGDLHYVCTHHLDVYTYQEEIRCNKWWDAHVRRLELTR